MSFNRKQCVASKDVYFQCLDGADDDLEKYKTEKSVFDEACLASWVTHFETQRFGTLSSGIVQSGATSGGTAKPDRGPVSSTSPTTGARGVAV